MLFENSINTATYSLHFVVEYLLKNPSDVTFFEKKQSGKIGFF